MEKLLKTISIQRGKSLVSLTTQKEARQVRDLPFCYLCGMEFEDEVAINHDHIPPESIFSRDDRNFPLKLAIHEEKCHRPMNLDDEILGQLIALIHGKRPSEKNDKIKLDIYQGQDTGKFFALFRQQNIEALLRRWLFGFHTSLYREPLGLNTQFAIQTPFPSAVIKGDKIIENPIKDQHYKFVECIKRNRAVNNLDCIVTNNGKLRYECVWDQLSDNSWACIFALNLYDWKDLGDVNNFQARGCVGIYSPPSRKAPNTACLATQLEFPHKNIDRADPFNL